MEQLPTGWREDEPGRRYLRSDGARAYYAPANAAKKTWASKGPNGELRKRGHGIHKVTVMYLTAENAMRAADRDWPFKKEKED